MNVIKRNGSEAIFDISKIEIAIGKANDTVPQTDRMSDEQIKDIASNVQAKCEELGHAAGVEDIQDMVEMSIMKLGFYQIAKNYITYRYERSKIRQKNTTDDKILSIIDQTNEEAKQENSNKNPVINSTQRDYMAGEISKDICERYIFPKDIIDAHKYRETEGVKEQIFGTSILNKYTKDEEWKKNYANMVSMLRILQG